MASRQAFVASQPHIDPTRLVFIDEMGTHQAMALSRGWAPRGKRLDYYVPKTRGRSVTSIGALSINGLLTLDVLDGSDNNLTFEEWVRRSVVPVLRPGDIVVMDNLKQHKQGSVAELVQGAGASVSFIPLYSPEFNAIEECWSKVKQFIRRAGPRTHEALLSVIAAARTTVTPSDAVGWIKHAGYAIST